MDGHDQSSDDGEMISRFLDGDAEAFNGLYQKYRKQLYGYLYRLMSGRKEQADDLFQQTWLKAIRQLPAYRNRDRFLSWLLRISHNLAIDFFRAEKRTGTIDAPLDTGIFHAIPEAANNAPDFGLERRELDAAIESGIAGLPPEQREVFLLRLDDVTFREIAEIQNVSINTALARMQYALRNLQKELATWKNRVRNDSQPERKGG
jgi:RNA polymerase sigma-70 factor (ECF subfamily)